MIHRTALISILFRIYLVNNVLHVKKLFMFFFVLKFLWKLSIIEREIFFSTTKFGNYFNYLTLFSVNLVQLQQLSNRFNYY